MKYDHHWKHQGINIKEGDYILAVNGRNLDPAIDPYAMFEGLAGKAVALRVNSKPTFEGSREVIIKTSATAGRGKTSSPRMDRRQPQKSRRAFRRETRLYVYAQYRYAGAD